MKRKFTLGIVSILTITALLLAGCANKQRVSSAMKAKNTTYQSSNTPSANTSTSNTTSSTNKDVKNITDNDLLKSADEDGSSQLDSVDNQSQDLSSDEINSLLNENTDLKNISSSFSVK